MIAKRLLDISVSALGLAALIPIFVCIAVLIKFSSPGPVFFRQIRVGQNQRHFEIYKFRTMRQDSTGKKITVGKDSRITSIGHFLRKTKIDELPQLINVLIGDMSLVGPRPEVPEYVAYYTPAQREKIFRVKPGITDRASLEFIDENELLANSTNPEQTYIQDILPRKIQFYLQYEERHSFGSDITIILQTIRAIFR